MKYINKIKYYLIYILLSIFYTSYSLKITGLYDNPQSNIANDAQIITKAKDIIDSSIGIINDKKIKRNEKIKFFMHNMKKNANFHYITKYAFYKNPKLKRIYFKDHKTITSLFSDYFVLSSLILLPQNTKNITINIHAITKQTNNKYTIKFLINNNGQKNDYTFYLDKNFLIYQITIDKINIANVYSDLLNDIFTQIKNKAKKERKNVNVAFMEKLNLMNRELKKQAIKQSAPIVNEPSSRPARHITQSLTAANNLRNKKQLKIKVRTKTNNVIATKNKNTHCQYKNKTLYLNKKNQEIKDVK